MTVKKDVQCYINKEAKKELDNIVKKQKKKNGSGIHSRDVASDIIMSHEFLLEYYIKSKKSKK